MKNLVTTIHEHQINLNEDDILDLLKIRNRWIKYKNDPPVLTITQWREHYWGEYYDDAGLFLFDQWKKSYDLGFTSILVDVTDLTQQLRDLEDKIRQFSGTRGNANFYLTKGSNIHRVSFADHFHDYDVIVKMIYGKCVWKIDNQYVELQNNTILIPANTTHSVVECTDKKLSLTINLQ